MERRSIYVVEAEVKPLDHSVRRDLRKEDYHGKNRLLPPAGYKWVLQHLTSAAWLSLDLKRTMHCSNKTEATLRNGVETMIAGTASLPHLKLLVRMPCSDSL